MPLSDVVEERFQRVWDHFDALQKANEKADNVFEVYRESANEFRGALSDQATRLLPRQEYLTAHATLVDKLNALQDQVLQNTANFAGRSSGISSVGYMTISLIAAIGVLASVISVTINLFHH